MPQGVTSASLIIVILVAAAVGAVVGGLLDQVGMDRTLLAIIAGFVATICAVVARNIMIRQVWGAGPDDTRIPIVVIVFALVSSLAGSLAGHEIIDDYQEFYSGVWIGTLAGLLSSLIMSMLMITYYMNPSPQGR
jgi:Na+-translocating ferredoxin:NAD+ oxidoreductase RnfE subunit